MKESVENENEVNLPLSSEMNVPKTSEQEARDKEGIWNSILVNASAYVGPIVSLIAVVVMSVADTCVEIGTQEFHPVQVTAIFSGAMFLTSACCTIVSGQLKEIERVKQSWGLLLFCGISNSVALTLINVAISVMPVGDAITILRSMPIFAGIFGWVWLKQQFRLSDMFFTLFCIAGVTLIARPSFIFPIDTDQQTSLTGVVLALASAVTFALSFVIGGKLSAARIHPFVTITVNATLTVILNTGLVVILRYCSPIDSCFHVVITIVGGTLHAVGQILVFVALSKERAVVVTVILAMEIVIVYVLQILLVGLIPHWLSGVAAVLILFACLGISAVKASREINRDVLQNSV